MPPLPRFLVIDSRRRLGGLVHELLGDGATVIEASERARWRGLLGASGELTGAIVAVRGEQELSILARLAATYPAVPILRLSFETERKDGDSRDFAVGDVVGFALRAVDDERHDHRFRRGVVDVVAEHVGWPPREREMVERVVIHGQSREEVEQAMGLTRQSFRNTVSRLLARSGFESLRALERHLQRQILRLRAGGAQGRAALMPYGSTWDVPLGCAPAVDDTAR